MKSQNMVMKLRRPSPATMLITVFFRSNFPAGTEFTKSHKNYSHNTLKQDDDQNSISQWHLLEKTNKLFSVLKYHPHLLSLGRWWRTWCHRPCTGSSSPPRGNGRGGSSNPLSQEGESCTWTQSWRCLGQNLHLVNMIVFKLFMKKKKFRIYGMSKYKCVHFCLKASSVLPWRRSCAANLFLILKLASQVLFYPAHLGTLKSILGSVIIKIYAWKCNYDNHI